MSGPERIELRHGRGRNLATAALCLALIGLFLWRRLEGRTGGDLLFLPALLLFGAYGGLALLRAFDRRPVAVLDREGLHLPDRLARPLPWRELVEVQERRFGRTRLLLYVRDLGPYRRPDRVESWRIEAILGKLLPGFERPRLVLETSGLDRPHRAIREALAAFWGKARAEGERALR